MHKVVNIGRLTVQMADCQLRTTAKAIVLTMPLLGGVAMAQQPGDADSGDVRTLPLLSVTAALEPVSGSADAAAVISRSQLSGVTAHSVGELLEQLPGVDLRTRGGGDVQGDIALRGGTFDQVMVLLNGINISDPQTGHHHLDIPIDLSMVDRVEIFAPSVLLHYGLTSYCGAVNIVTTDGGESPLRFEAKGGSNGTADVALGTHNRLGNWQ